MDRGVHDFLLVHEKRNAIERIGDAFYSSCIQGNSVLSSILGKQTGKFSVCSEDAFQSHGSEIILKCFNCYPQENLTNARYPFPKRFVKSRVIENHITVASANQNCCLSRNNYFLGITPYSNSDVCYIYK